MTTKIKLADEVLVALEPVRGGVRSMNALRQLLRYLGLELESPISNLGSVAEPIEVLAQQVLKLAALGDDEPVAESLISKIDPIWNAIDALKNAQVDVTLPDRDIVAELDDALLRLPAVLLIQYLDARVPILSDFLRALGVIRREGDVQAEFFDPANFGRLVDEGPKKALLRLYEFFLDSDWQAGRLQIPLSDLLVRLGANPTWSAVPDSWTNAGTPLLEPGHPQRAEVRLLNIPLLTLRTPTGPVAAGLVLAPVPTNAVDGALDSLFVGPYSTLTVDDSIRVGDWTFQLPVAFDYPAAGVTVRPTRTDPRVVPEEPLTGDFPITVGVTGSLPDTLRFAIMREEDAPISIAGGSVTLSGLFAAVEIDPPDGFRIEGGTAPDGIKFSLDFAKGDKFTGEVVGASLEVTLDFGIAFDSIEGIDLDLGAQLEFFYTPPGPPGPISLDGLYLRMGFDFSTGNPGGANATGLSASLAALISIRLGIVFFTISEVGLDAQVTFGQRGNLGPANFSWGFRPPRGIGILIGNEDTPVRGGGFITLEPELSRYSGALEVVVLGLELAVLGTLVTPPASNPSAAWSLLLVITSQFSGVPLGGGLKLTGIGGLLLSQESDFPRFGAPRL